MRHSSRRQKQNGRAILATFYVVYLILYMLTIVLMPSHSSRAVVGSVMITMLWITVLWVAMWVGHNWARYLFMCLLAITVVFTVPLLSEVADAGMSLPVTIWALAGFHVVVLSTLIYSSAIHALVRR